MALEVKRDKCPTHSDQDVAGNCGFCGKDICRECISANGYYCSEDCQAKNRDAADAAQKSKSAASKASFEKGMRTFRLVKYALLLIVLVAIGIFVYRVFLDPSGKQAWAWMPTSEMDPVIVGAKDGVLYVMDDEDLQAIRLKNGNVLTTTAVPKLAGMKQFRILGDRLIGISPLRICAAGLDGKKAVNVELPIAPEGDPVLNDDCSKAYYVSRKSSDDARESGYTLVLNTVDLSSGTMRSNKGLKGSPDRASVLGVTPAGIILQTGKEKKSTKPKSGKTRWQIREYDWAIELVDLNDGDGMRRVSLPKQPDETPVLAAGWVRFPVGKTLYVLDMANKVQHKIAIQVTEFTSPEHTIVGDQLFVVYKSGIVCYGLADGEKQWQVNAGGRTKNIYFGKDRIILLGGKSANKKIDVSKMPGFNQAKDVVEDFGIGKGVLGNMTPVMAAIDRKSGKLIWEEEGIEGNLLADKERIVLIKQSGGFGLQNESNELYVRQFDPDSGKKIVSEVIENLAMDQPLLFDNRAVGMQYSDKGETSIIAIHLK